ncbi:ATP-dependent DNA helicase RecG [Bartonella tamiae]|uniref:ATP-dependent DNA helicase RecG n=1 Tax=Bartonella tamiae Th239 TaxID=1094558 RepID=J0QS38_9HYPH|nr:ATP-dependent DNA helicase RecG [Bartonella tamiae]EJF88671.1 ATP-dependent DNA helicase RecG [Bartonella tamiae Th239]EJF95079.1 ATP-dependent DNA helicase RecG [Bartonella tamiae Th307]
MRPSLLDPLFASIRSLQGIGPKVSASFSKLLNIELTKEDVRLIDLLQLMPTGVIDRRHRPGIAFSESGSVSTFEITVGHHTPPSNQRPHIPYRVTAFDHTGEISLVFFHAQRSWLEKQLPIGEKVIISGKVDWFNGKASMVHPDYIVLASQSELMPIIEPIYPSTAGLSGKIINRTMLYALERLPLLPEWLDKNLKIQMDFPSFDVSLRRLHKPIDPFDLEKTSPSYKRLAYDELLAGQLALGMVRLKTKQKGGRSHKLKKTFTEQLKKSLPFRLTKGQEDACKEIAKDLASPQRMLRLLQGDVGSGKTIVALMAMAQIAENERQSAIMAPTEVLARQHYSTIAPLAEKLGLQTVLLTGREKGKIREAILTDIETGKTSIIIGTHALIQNNVIYHDLALAIIDEQHRFGVHQRLQLSAKGYLPDFLVMTATPIPRTLVLTAFGDMDVSKLTEKPIGRKLIKTATLPIERLEELLQRILNALKRGEKIYWICPLVEESENLDLISAQDRYIILKERFGSQIGLIHGKMSGNEKDIAMDSFKKGIIRLLVSTTVIEVGVDVPDASIIIIEHAERFGLSQLHQLRGRVGRSDKDSSCILLYKSPLGKTAQARLNIMRETQDGFVIAEEDLRLRGEGELLGTKQSGVPNFSMANLEVHSDLLTIARKDAKLILETDPDLLSERGQALRLLLYLFKRNEAIKLLRAG